MNKKIQEKYRFNLKTGHYEILRHSYAINEDEGSAVQSSVNSASVSTENDNEEKVVLRNIKTEEVNSLQNAMNTEVKKISDEIQKYKEQLTQIESKHISAIDTFNNSGTQADANNVANIQKQILQLKKQISDAAFKKAETKHKYEIDIITLQNKILESIYHIPTKYKCLNESNIQSAKVYINDLFGPDSIMKGMVDFKKVFKHSQLFYGKDNKGYFTLCIDQEDFDRMYKALTDVGYSRDSIIDTIMPQVFDRRELVQK